MNGAGVDVCLAAVGEAIDAVGAARVALDAARAVYGARGLAALGAAGIVARAAGFG
jgi:hypothetical protein